MSGWTIAYYTFLLAAPVFVPSLRGLPATENRTVAALMVVGMLIASILVLVFIAFKGGFTTGLVVSSLVGTAVVIASALIISDRWGKWGQLLFNLTFGGVGLLIYDFVPKVGSDAAVLYFCFALAGLYIIELIRLLQQHGLRRQ